MPRRRRKVNSPSGVFATIIVVAILLVAVVGCFYHPIHDFAFDAIDRIQYHVDNISFEPDGTLEGLLDEIKGVFSELSQIFEKDNNAGIVDGEIAVHFVDVGQGDCAVICTSEGNIIVDAGTNSSEDEMLAYIDKLGIKSFKYAIFTHPHEDHIGGADAIMKNYSVENVIIPDFAATSKTYLNMMDSIEQSGADVKVIEANEEYQFTVGSLVANVLGPVEIDNDLNNASIVMRVEYGKTSLLFMGDAEVSSEELLLQKYKFGKLRSDIIKLGHHGSETSSSLNFLQAVSPSVAIISCGVDNTYGHPHAKILHRLESEGIAYHRTDKEGSIVYIINADGYAPK